MRSHELRLLCNITDCTSPQALCWTKRGSFWAIKFPFVISTELPRQSIDSASYCGARLQTRVDFQGWEEP